MADAAGDSRLVKIAPRIGAARFGARFLSRVAQPFSFFTTFGSGL
jgi:hypothetical protein